MGSTGTGTFSDYSNRKPQNEDDETGGKGKQDGCAKAISTRLEDVERCTYFIENKGVPPIGTEVEIYFSGRIIARTTDGKDVGYLPTRYNYIRPCMENGYNYIGTVLSSSNIPVPSVTIDIVPYQ